MALFKTTAEIKKHVPSFNKNITWATLEPFAEQSELKYIVPLLGNEQYVELESKYQANTMTAAQTALLKQVQRPLAYYIFYEAQPFLSVQVGDMGVQEQSSSEGTSNPARQWVANNLRRSAIKSADTFADKLLEYLETNHETFPKWTASTAYTKTRDSFVNTTAQLAEHLHIGNSRRTFLALRPFISLVEKEFILPALKLAILDDLKAKIADELNTPIPASSADMIEKIRRVVAWLAYYRALPHLAIDASMGEIHVTSQPAAELRRSPIDRERYKTAVTAAETTGMAFLRELTEYLDCNRDTIEAYAFGYEVTLDNGETLDLKEGDLVDLLIVTSASAQDVTLESSSGAEDVIPTTTFTAAEKQVFRADFLALSDISLTATTTVGPVTINYWKKADYPPQDALLDAMPNPDYKHPDNSQSKSSFWV